ncbi:MAG: hypothetical protein JRM85_05010 [Nitrososphaerota archaeon]|jgi:hypothetical protein|nr:hypothetical protein [Nitrososphaerota archaeon]
MSRSDATKGFADNVRNRLLGNADDQSVLAIDEKPHRKFVTGVIYTIKDQSAQLAYQEYKSKVTPNSYSVEVALSQDKFNASVTLSFWLWFQNKSEETGGNLVGDLFTEEILWTPWDARTSVPTVSAPLGIEPEEETTEDDDDLGAHAKFMFVRKRYCKVLEFGDGEISAEGRTRDKPWKEVRSLDDDLRLFGLAHSNLGIFPKWRGQATCEAWMEKGVPRMKITVENLCRDKKGEPCWFDARMDARTSKPLKIIEVPELQQLTKAVTNNCIRDFNADSDDSSVQVEQVGMITIPRSHPIASVSFKEVAGDPVGACNKVVHQLEDLGANQETVVLAKSAVEILAQDEAAARAVSLTSQVFSDYFTSKSPEVVARWYLFQITSLLIGLGSFVGNSSIPMIENVPTNAGKTEAFFSCMLFASFYGRLEKKRVVNVVKYPYRMLSRQQKERIAAYMVFAEEIAAKNKMGSLVLGYFAGLSKTGKPLQPGQSKIMDEVARKCPLCKEEWRLATKLYESDDAAALECKKGHKLIMATGDAVFAAAPAIIIATPDKFVAKSYKDETGSILGSLVHHCSVHGYTLHSQCRRSCTGTFEAVDPVRVGFWTLDESHLIREEEGTKDTHYEKGHTDIAQLNSGIGVIPIISTATISGISHFIAHLGFGRTFVMVPAEKDRELFLEREEGENAVQHAVVVIEPRNRAVVFALGRMVEEWVNVLHENHIEIGLKATEASNLDHLSHMMLYFPSYDKLYQTWDQLVNDVNRVRRNRGQSELKIEEATGRLTEAEIEEWFRLVDQHEIDVTLATKLASIGIDVESLNVLGFYGVPTQMSEFVQVLNRTARRTPGVAFIVLDPGKERDRSYYDYMDLFVSKAGSLVEEIPLNRFARSAIRYTFYNVLFSLLLFHYGPRNSSDYRRASNVLADLSSGKLSESTVVSQLKQTFLASEDLTGAYGPLVEELWRDFTLSLSSPGVTYIWDKYWGTKWLPNSLRGTADQDVTVISDKTVDDAMYYQLLATRGTEDEADDVEEGSPGEEGE